MSKIAKGDMNQTDSLDDLAETIGHDIADKADNFLAMGQMPGIPPGLLLDGYRQGLEEIRQIAREAYVSLTGENPWEDGGAL